MLGNEFLSIQQVTDLGETIFCVYFYVDYEVTRAIQYLKWKGFRTDLMYRLDNCLIFYQDELFVPELDVVDNFYRELNDINVWEKCNGLLNDYKYRVISKGVICISFINIEDAEAIKFAGKFKKE